MVTSSMTLNTDVNSIHLMVTVRCVHHSGRKNANVSKAAVEHEPHNAQAAPASSGENL